MKRFFGLVALAWLVLTLTGCGQSKEEQFSKKVESRIIQIEQRADQALQAKNNLDTNLLQLQQDLNSLRTSIEQMRSALDGLKKEADTLRDDQNQFQKELESGGFWKWLLVLIVLGVIGYLGYLVWPWRRKSIEDEEEDFSALGEETAFDDKIEDEPGPDKSDRPMI